MPVTPATSRGSSSGGGFDLASSYGQFFDGTSPTGLPADGTTHFLDFDTVEVVAGSDIARNSGDHTKIDLLTNGRYMGFIQATLIFAPGAGSTAAAAELFSWETFDFDALQTLVVGSGTLIILILPLEPQQVADAPHSCRFAVDITADGVTPTFSVSSARLVLQRLA